MDGTQVPGPAGVGGTNLRFGIAVFFSPDLVSGRYIGSVEVPESLDLSALALLLSLLDLDLEF
jgi:hypothetical protein